MYREMSAQEDKCIGRRVHRERKNRNFKWELDWVRCYNGGQID